MINTLITPPKMKYFDRNNFLCLVINIEIRKAKMKKVMEYLFKKASPNVAKMAIHHLGLVVFISFSIRYADKSQKNWLNDTGWNKVFDRKNDGEKMKAANPTIKAQVLPFSSLIILAIMNTDTVPIIAGKKRRAKTVLPNRNTDIFDKTAINGGTDR